MRFHSNLTTRVLFKCIVSAILCLLVSVVTFAQVQDSGRRSAQADLFDKPTFSPSLARELDKRIAKLDSEYWDERIQAADWLRSLDIHTVILEDMLDASYLSNEQKHQLLAITSDRILRAPVGAIGISMEFVIDEEIASVRVTGLIAGMPGEKVLKINDLITSINGKKIESNDSLRKVISAYRPGNILKIELNREGDNKEVQTLLVELELADATRLNDNGRHSGSVERDRKIKADILVATKAPPPVFLDVPNFLSLAEQHPSVLELRRQLEDIQKGKLERTSELEEKWKQTLAKLFEQARDPHVGISERNRRREIYMKYLELLNR